MEITTINRISSSVPGQVSTRSTLVVNNLLPTRALRSGDCWSRPTSVIDGIARPDKTFPLLIPRQNIFISILKCQEPREFLCARVTSMRTSLDWLFTQTKRRTASFCWTLDESIGLLAKIAHANYSVDHTLRDHDTRAKYQKPRA